MPFLPPNQQRQNTEGTSTEGVTITVNQIEEMNELSGVETGRTALVVLMLAFPESNRSTSLSKLPARAARR